MRRRHRSTEALAELDSVPGSEGDPDLPLALALQAGDERALDAIMNRHQAGLHRFVCRYLLDDYAQAADVVQETFVRVFFRIGQFQPKGAFAAWLYRIALNLCRDHARSASAKQARMNLSFAEDGETLPDGSQALPGRSDGQSPHDPSDEAAAREEMRLLETAINELPHDLKSALILNVLEGRSQQDCAALLDTTLKAVETRVYRARKLLAKRMQSVLR